MKLKKPSGVIVEASIEKGKSIVFISGPESTGMYTRKQLEEYITEKSRGEESLEDYLIIEATDNERELLKEANFNMKGLDYTSKRFYCSNDKVNRNVILTCTLNKVRPNNSLQDKDIFLLKECNSKTLCGFKGEFNNVFANNCDACKYVNGDTCVWTQNSKLLPLA
jgi:hypothetical protein